MRLLTRGHDCSGQEEKARRGLVLSTGDFLTFGGRRRRRNQQEDRRNQRFAAENLKRRKCLTVSSAEKVRRTGEEMRASWKTGVGVPGRGPPPTGRGPGP